jgi:hypothetical protein
VATYDQGGIIIKSGFTRYSGRVNLERNVSKKVPRRHEPHPLAHGQPDPVERQLAGQLHRDGRALVQTGRSGDAGRRQLPAELDGHLAGRESGGEHGGPRSARTLFNAIGNGFAEYAFTDELRLALSLGVTAVLRPLPLLRAAHDPGGRRSQGSAQDQSGENYNVVNENTLELAPPAARNALDLLGGFTVQTAARRVDRTPQHALLRTTSSASTAPLGNAAGHHSSPYNESALLSYLGRATYNVKDRYLLTLTGRADGSSRFG